MCFCWCFLNWSLLPSGAAAVPKKGCAISCVVACIMLRGKVYYSTLKQLLLMWVLHTIFNTVMWNDTVMKSVRFIFFHLKHEKHNLPYLKKKKIYSPPPNTHIWYKWSWWVWLHKAMSHMLGQPDCLLTNWSGTPWAEHSPAMCDKDLTWQFYSCATHGGLEQQKRAWGAVWQRPVLFLLPLWRKMPMSRKTEKLFSLSLFALFETG